MALFDKLTGTVGREHEPTTQILTDERQALEEALEKATRTPKKVAIPIDGENYVVFDDGYGRRVRKIK